MFEKSPQLMPGPLDGSTRKVAMASTVPQSRSVLLAACGMVAPFVYTAAAVVASLKYPGYHHLKNAISELGATGAPSATIMNFAGFLPYGVLMVAFALAVHRGIRADVGGWLGPSVLVVYGLSYIGLAFASCDPGCQASTPSLHHRMHLLLGDVIFLAAVLGPFTLYPRMVRDPAWRSLAVATLVLPASAWLIPELSGIGMSGPLRQRLWLLLLFLWIEMMAIRLLGFGAAPRQRPAPQAAAYQAHAAGGRFR